MCMERRVCAGRSAWGSWCCAPGFSGSDVYLKVWSALQREWFRRFGRTVVVKSLYACECGAMQQEFLKREHPDTTFLFDSMEESQPRSPRLSRPLAAGGLRS